MFIAMKGKHDGEKGGKKSGKIRDASVKTIWENEALQIAQVFVQNNPDPKNFNPTRIAHHIEETKDGAKNKRSFDTYRKAVRRWIESGMLVPVAPK
jgi:radical SAM superfamily enzyme with C-terminal helix-hairpin-helix motif